MRPQATSARDRALYAAVLGQVIRLLRGQTRQAVIAAQSGLSSSALSRFETGQTMPDLHEARALARALGVDLALMVALVEPAFRRAQSIVANVEDPMALVGAAMIASSGVLSRASRHKGKSSDTK